MSPSLISPVRHRRIRALAWGAGALVAALALTGCAPADAPSPGTDPSDSPAPSSSSSAPETPSSTPTVDPRDAMAADLADAITSGNTAAVEGYLTEPTRVVIAASEADGPYSAVDAVLALDYVQPGVGSWDFAIDQKTLEVYRANPYYGQFFPSGVVAGRSSGGPVVAFVPMGDRIGTIFMSIDETLITQP